MVTCCLSRSGRVLHGPLLNAECSSSRSETTGYEPLRASGYEPLQTEWVRERVRNLSFHAEGDRNLLSLAQRAEGARARSPWPAAARTPPPGA